MYLYSPPDFHSFESIMSLTERRGRNVNSQWKKISEVNRQTHGNSCIFLFLFLHIITFPEKQLYLSDCGFECYANCTLNLPQDCSELFCFFYFFSPIRTFVNTKSLSGSCEIYKFSCVTADSMQIKLPILSDVF